MPAHTLALLEPDLRKVSLEQGAVLLEPGELIENIYFPLTGLISLMIIGKDGNFIETSTVGREGAVGLHSALGRRRSLTRATAQIGGKFSTIGAARFEHVVNGSATIRDVISRYTEVLWAETQQIAACNAMHGASARLCQWLLQSADRIRSDQVPLTQELLAQMLGARRTTVTLLAQRLQAKGLIRYRRGRIVIIDRNGLEACACECYHVMHDEKLPQALGVKL